MLRAMKHLAALALAGGCTPALAPALRTAGAPASGPRIGAPPAAQFALQPRRQRGGYLSLQLGF